MSANLDNTLNNLEELLKLKEEQERKAELAEKEKQIRKKQIDEFKYKLSELISKNEVGKVREGLKLDETKEYYCFNRREEDCNVYNYEFSPYKTEDCPSPEMADVLIKDACIRYGKTRHDAVKKYANRIINRGLKENPERGAEWIGVLRDNNFLEDFKVSDMASYEKAIEQGHSIQCFDFERVVKEYYNAKCGYLVDTPCGQGDSFIAYREPNKEAAQRKKELLVDVLSKGYKPNIKEENQVRCFLTELAREKSMNISEKDFFEKIGDYGLHRGFSRMSLPASSEKLPIPKQFNSGFKGFCEGNFDGAYATSEDFIGLVYAVSDDGKVVEAGCRNGKLYGDYEERSAEGNVIKAHYKDGQLHGDYEERSAEGKAIKAHYKDGQLHGDYEEKSAEGKVIKAHYKDGQLHGDYEERSAEGKVIKAHYKDGQLHGEYHEIASNGLVIEEKYYENGVNNTRMHNIKKRLKEQKEAQYQKIEDQKLPKFVKDFAKKAVDFDKEVQRKIKERKLLSK